MNRSFQENILPVSMTGKLRKADDLVIDRVWVVSGQAGFEWNTRIPALRSYDEPSTNGQYQLLEAMLPEFAARAGAMRAGFDFRLRPFKHGSSRRYDGFPAGHETLRIQRYISVEEADGGISRSMAQGTFNVANGDGRNANLISLKHPRLCRDIADLVRFDAATILYFDQPPAAPVVWLKDISPNDHTLPLECSFENGETHRSSEQFLGARDGGWNLKMIFRD